MAKKPLKSIQFAGLADTYTVPTVIEETNPLITQEDGIVLDTVMTPSEVKDAVRSGLTLNVQVIEGDAMAIVSYAFTALIQPEGEEELLLRFQQVISDIVISNQATIMQLLISVKTDGTMTVIGHSENVVKQPLTRSEILNAAYPVGAIYMSTSATSPATLFGGVWMSIHGKFLLAESSSYPEGTTGGEAAHTLTVDEMPAHNHSADFWSNAAGDAGYGGTPATNYDCWNRPTERMTANVGSTGGGAAHNNMPPYLAVYMWQRTA